MPNKTVVIIAFEEHDNLGVGYITSVLIKGGFTVKIIDFRIDREAILEKLKQFNPLIVGFSIIFQYHLYRFKDLIVYLRKNQIRSHFCAGGYYPSLRHKDLFQLIPLLDSIVLFEGEYTFFELVNALYKGKEWREIKGISYRDDGEIVTNQLRPLEKDLDKFPVPFRQPSMHYALGKKFANLLAGRGCYYDCSFCIIREFYTLPPGPIKRIRNPEKVVGEMEMLHKDSDCSIFLFQDDDFPVAIPQNGKWIKQFCELLSKKKLVDKIMWKISCRPDEVVKEKFALMKKHGLYLVFLGIENGTDAGLKYMNKHLLAEQNKKAVQILKDLGIHYFYGFMLFHPDSTFDSVRDNLKFLRIISGDGSSPIILTKMIPYLDTNVERDLRKKGRLTGIPGFLNYNFLDPSLDDYYAFIAKYFREWMGNRNGLFNVAEWAMNYISVYEKYYPVTPDFQRVARTITNAIAGSNNYFLDTLETLALLFMKEKHMGEDEHLLEKFRAEIPKFHSLYNHTLMQCITSIESMVALPEVHYET